MKKFLTVLLSAAMLIAAPATIFADENIQELGSTDESDVDGSIDLEAIIVSSYTLKLPTKVDVKNNSTTFDIYAKGDVDGAKKIVISEDNAGNNELTDASGVKTAQKLTVSFGQGILGSDIKADYDTAKETVTVTHDTLLAGSWSCELPIVIQLA